MTHAEIGQLEIPRRSSPLLHRGVCYPSSRKHGRRSVKRRDFISLLGGTLVAWPLAARGQEPGRIYRFGSLHSAPRDAPHQVALLDDLRRLGFAEGQNLAVDWNGYGLSIHRVARREEIANAIDTAKAADAGALNVLASALLFNNRTIIFDRVATLRLPAVYQWPEMAEQGGLIGYGPLIVQLYRDIMSRQLAKLLRGSKPADLPVAQPTRFELVINLKTATAIGHDVPAAPVLRADQVIEWALLS